MKNYLLKLLSVGLFAIVLLFASPQTLWASITHTATKNCQSTPCTVTGTGSFAATSRLVRWYATYNGSGGQGNDFYLSSNAPNMADIAISTSLVSGVNSGTFLLPATGSYFISINTALMGQGSYTIEYNLEPDCVVTPPTFNFGSRDAGSSGVNHTFTIALAGDNLDVTIGAISGTDNTHFVISGGTGTTLRMGGPASVNFTVRFEPGTSAGTFSSTITIVTSNASGLEVPDKTITVTGITKPLEPDIECVPSTTYSLDYIVSTSGTFSKSFKNVGNAPLQVSSISLNGNPGGVFSLVSNPAPVTVAPGSSIPVSIRFTPPAFEQIYTGSIVIVSNAPGEESKTCSFIAKAHHPEPKMEFYFDPPGSNVINYRDVEIGFTYTKAIRVRNSGDAPLTFSLNLIDPLDPDLSQWSEINEPDNVTIAAGAEQTFLQRFKPRAIGAYGFEMQALGTGGAGTYNETVNITLIGNGITPVPMDNVLVLDRSGSMDESAGARTKIDALQKAARLYYDLLRPDPGDGSGDQIALVKYNNSGSSYLTPLQPKNSANEPGVLDLLSEASITNSSRLKPSGGTCISCGMTQGADQLLASPDSRKQVMVVMTDGHENAGPGVTNTFLNDLETANPDLMIYSLGLGNDINEPLLQRITNAGNGGYHHVSEDLLGNNHFALEEFYFKIYSNASGADLIVDPTSGVNLASGNPVEVNRARIVSSDRYAVFMVLDDPALAGYYKLEFIDPHGTIIDPTSSVAGIPIQMLKRAGHTVYKIIFPDISQASSYVGDWVLRLSPTGKWRADSTRKEFKPYQVAGEWISPYQGVVPIGFGAAVKSDYKMAVQVSADHYKPGALVLLTAQLSDRGWPSTGGQIEITATRPDGTGSTFKLYDDGTHGDIEANDGTYSSTYNQTALKGSYRFFFNGKGINERGELVPRQATRYVSLFEETGPIKGDGKNCFPCWLYYAMLLLLLLILLVIIRCCRKQEKLFVR